MFLKYSRNFWFICFASLFFMMSFNLILPQLNDFITILGGGNYKGLIITLFTISAGATRPFSGKLSDTIGRKKVMIIGAVIGSLIGLLYPITGLLTFFLLRFLHGFSAGFLFTAATAIVTDILPEKQRGVGMGIWGTFFSVGFGLAQMSTTVIVDNLGVTSLFMIGVGLAVISLALISFVDDTLPEPEPFKWSLLKIKWKDVMEPTVIPAFVVMFFYTISTGIVFVIVPDMTSMLDIENKGWFFGFYTIPTILVRLFAGGLSDVIGRRKTLLIGMTMIMSSMVFVAFAQEVIQFTIGAIVFGIGTGLASPTIFSWTADLSPVDRRGVGAGTVFIALESGIMIGSFSTLLTYNNTINSITNVFLVGVGAALISILYLIWHLLRRTSNT